MGSGNKVNKIVIIGPAYPLRGGIANFNDSLSRALTKEGINNVIYSFSLQYPSFLFPGKTQFEIGPKPEDIEIKSVINSINPISWIKTAKQIIKENPDLIIVRYWLPFMAPCLGSILRLIKKKYNKKIIAITDNVIPHEKRPGDKQLTTYFVKSCDGFISMSKAVLEELNAFTSSPYKLFQPHPLYDTFGNKVDKHTALKHLHLSENNKYILFFGFIRKYKGLDLLLKAFADKRLRNLNVKLIVAGEFYDNEQEYLQLINALNIQESVIIHNKHIPAEMVKYYFCASDIVAQTYITASQSGVTQIAYQLERPMLVTNVGGLSELVPHNIAGYVVEKDTVKIADALIDFFEHNKEIEFCKNIVTEKEKFSWSAFVKGVLNLNESMYEN